MNYGFNLPQTFWHFSWNEHMHIFFELLVDGWFPDNWQGSPSGVTLHLSVMWKKNKNLVFLISLQIRYATIIFASLKALALKF